MARKCSALCTSHKCAITKSIQCFVLHGYPTEPRASACSVSAIPIVKEERKTYTTARHKNIYERRRKDGKIVFCVRLIRRPAMKHIGTFHTLEEAIKARDHVLAEERKNGYKPESARWK